MIELKSDLIQEYIKTNNNIIVMFGSSNCEYCNKLKPQLNQLSNQHPDKLIIFVDGDKFENSADLYNIEYYPTIVHIVNQIPINRFVTKDFKKISQLWQ